MTEPLDIEHFRSLLLAAREEILSLTETREATAATVTLDQASVGRLSRMDALQQQAMAINNRQRARMSLTRIDAALLRCNDGSYGLCIDCEEPIPAPRLTFDPTALRCIDCATASESE